MHPKYTIPGRTIKSGSRDALSLTVSDQYTRDRVMLPTPMVDLYCPSERHYDHNEIKGHDTVPGLRQNRKY